MPVINGDHLQSRAEQRKDTGACVTIKFLAFAQSQMSFEQGIGHNTNEPWLTTNEKAREYMWVRSQKHLYWRWRSSIAVRNSLAERITQSFV